MGLDKDIMKLLDNSLLKNDDGKTKETGHIVSLISTIRHSAHEFIMEELKKNGINGLVTSHGEILVQLFYSKEPVTMQMLAKGIRRDKSTVTTLVNKLQKQGYVEKKQSTVDKRVTYIVLTDEGLVLKPIFSQISETLISKFYGDMSQKERVLVVLLLERIASNF